MFTNYLKIAFRNILRHKIFSIINITGLAVSMSVCLLVIKMIFGMYSSDRFHENGNRIYRVLTSERTEGYSGWDLATTPEPLAEELENLTDVEKIVKIRKNFSGDVYYKGNIIPISGLFSNHLFFEVFSFKLERGDPHTALKEPYSIILTPEWAEKLFGETDPLGEMISLKNLGEYKVTGITKPVSQLKTHLKFDCIASASTLPSLENQGIASNTIGNWGNPYRTYTFILLREGAKTEIIENALPDIVDTFVPKSETHFEYSLQQLKDISPGKRLANQMGNTTEPMIAYILILVAVILMLTAGFTYTTLSVARAFDRAREVGMRKVFGASRHQLIAQFIGEAVLLSLISLNFAYIILTFIEPGVYNFDYHIREFFELTKTPITIYLAFLLFTLILGGLTGLFPALYLSRIKPVNVFKDLSGIRIFSRKNLRKVLIVVQFTISLFLIFSVIISFKQIRYQQGIDYGYNIENILNVDLQEVNYKLFKSEILQKPGVQAVAASEYLPGTGTVHRDFIKCEKLPDSMVISRLVVDPDFIRTMNMSLLLGEDFREYSETNLSNYTIINESAIQFLGFRNAGEALEYTLTINSKPNIQIIGVVKDFVLQSPDSKPDPLVMRVIPDLYNHAFVKLNPNFEMKEIIASIEESWKKQNPEQQFRYKFFSENIGEYLNLSMRIVQVIGFITFFAVFISILGLLGMVVFNNESRINEIGIRKVMGATSREVLWTISRSFVYMMALAGLIATPVAWFLGNMILQYSYNRVKLEPGFFVFGILFLLIIGMTTVFSQTWKTANRNPVDALRYE